MRISSSLSRESCGQELELEPHRARYATAVLSALMSGSAISSNGPFLTPARCPPAPRPTDASFPALVSAPSTSRTNDA